MRSINQLLITLHLEQLKQKKKQRSLNSLCSVISSHARRIRSLMVKNHRAKQKGMEGVSWSNMQHKEKTLYTQGTEKIRATSIIF